MPELPEVETIVCGLRTPLAGRTIPSVTVLWARTSAFPSPAEFVALLAGRRVVSVGCRAKYVVVEPESGALRTSRPPSAVLIHLKICGRLRVLPAAEPPGSHTRLFLDLDDGQQLRFDDARKFGRAYLLDDPVQVTAALGPEPLAVDFSAADVCCLLAPRKGRLKSLLLNQVFLAGLGNIYADEALFAARLHPLRKADSLDSDEQVRLYDAIRLVLGRAVEGHGTTLDDRGYVDALGKAGAYQEEIAVYGRKGQPCVRCGTPVERIVIGGRSVSALRFRGALAGCLLPDPRRFQAPQTLSTRRRSGPTLDSRCRIEGLQCPADGFVQVGPGHFVQVTVEVFLDHATPEAVERQALPAHPLEADRVHQSMPLAQWAAQAAENLGFVGALYAGYHLGGELLALNRGDGQRPLPRARQAADPLRDDRFYPGRQLFPIQRRPFYPVAGLVLHQVAALAQAPQHLHREQRVPSGL